METCFAPARRAKYSGVKEFAKLSLFGIPENADIWKEWEINLHYAYEHLNECSAVCEIGFEPQYVNECIHDCFLVLYPLCSQNVLCLVSSFCMSFR